MCGMTEARKELKSRVVETIRLSLIGQGWQDANAPPKKDAWGRTPEQRMKEWYQLLEDRERVGQ